jgi:hypothetical protein
MAVVGDSQEYVRIQSVRPHNSVSCVNHRPKIRDNLYLAIYCNCHGMFVYQLLAQAQLNGHEPSSNTARTCNLKRVTLSAKICRIQCSIHSSLLCFEQTLNASDINWHDHGTAFGNPFCNSRARTTWMFQLCTVYLSVDIAQVLN